MTQVLEVRVRWRLETQATDGLWIQDVNAMKSEEKARAELERQLKRRFDGEGVRLVKETTTREVAE
jgi:hypothetical protein